MIKRDELSNPNSCLNTADDDEPLFVLKGCDRHAPALVWLWAIVRALEGEDADVVLEARLCARRMIEHQKKLGRPHVLPGDLIGQVLAVVRSGEAFAKFV